MTSLIALCDNDSTSICACPTERQAWFDWIFTQDPPIPEGQHSVMLDESNTPDGLLDALDADDTSSLTSGSYENDKAQIVYLALSESGEGEFDYPITIDAIYSGMWY